MIILHQLTIRDFKSLRSVDLSFPPQASVLIQGLNESGKSTLFEAIYFALYGEALALEETNTRGKGRNESAIRYQAQQAVVRLVVEIDGTRLEIERTLRHSAQAMKSKLVVRYPNGTHETITAQVDVTERIVQELGNLTKEAVLNSCFVEQKKLGKLEEMKSEERRASLEYLLNLSKLQSIQQQFKVTPEESREAERAKDRFDYAQRGAALPHYASEVEDAKRRLALALIARQFAAIRAEQRQQQATQTALASRNNDHQRLASQQARIGALKAGREHLGVVEAHAQRWRDTQAEAQRVDQSLAHCDQIQQVAISQQQQHLRALRALSDLFAKQTALTTQIDLKRTAIASIQAELDGIDRQRDEATSLARTISTMEEHLQQDEAAIDSTAARLQAELHQNQTRLDALKALSQKFADWQRLREQQQELARMVAQHTAYQREVDEHQRELQRLRDTLATQTARLPGLTQAEAQARQHWRDATEHAALEQWLRGAEEATNARQQQQRQAEAQAKLAGLRSGLVPLQAQARQWQQQLRLRGGIAGIVAVVGVVLLSMGHMWSVALLAGAGAGGWWAWQASNAASAAQTHLRTHEAAVQTAQGDLTQLEIAARIRTELGGGDQVQRAATERLHNAGLAVPQHLAQAQARFAQLPTPAGALPDLERAWHLAESALQDAQWQQKQTTDAQAERQRLLTSAQGRLAGMADPTAPQEAARAHALALEADIAATAQFLAVQIDASLLAQALTEQDRAVRQNDRDLAAISGKREALEVRRKQVQERQGELRAINDQLASRDVEKLRAKLASEQQILELWQPDLQAKTRIIAKAAQDLGIPPQVERVQQAIGSAIKTLEDQQHTVAQRPYLVTERANLASQMQAETAAANAAWHQLRQTVPELDVGEVPELDPTAFALLKQRLAQLLTQCNYSGRGCHR